MTELKVQDRYDQFQEPAVSNIVSDFGKKLQGRFLLVIPTAGGKTFTAVKAVNKLFEVGTLNAKQDRVLWTAHRNELITQAMETFERFEKIYPDRPSFATNVDFRMIGIAERHLTENNSVRLVILDEAHHAALKNVNYGPIFRRTNLGILGLTATPSRHDGDPLDFERESFSIGFPDLVKKGIVLKPEVRKVHGGTYQISRIDDEDSLEQLDNRERNERIIGELLKHPQDYKKVIVYVGTKSHAKSLYDQLVNSPIAKEYESIASVTGDTNSRTQDRSKFIEQEKKYKRSILVNVMVLSEGYDDPSINTVVMATPSKSKLYYMQAMGRAIRHDPNDPIKKAFCIEVEDVLPNIRYRIDNRWLFSDVSDSLEPAVIDKEYGTAIEFAAAFTSIFDTYNVPPVHRAIPEYDNNQRYSMLLFKRYLAPNTYAHFPLIISNDNRLQVSNMFNFLSERMERFRKQGVVHGEVLRMAGDAARSLLNHEDQRRWVCDAMKCAVPKDLLDEPDVFSEAGYPWITFVSFQYRQSKISDEIAQFIEEMVNRDTVLESLMARDFEKGSYLIRLPLPLQSYIGKFITAKEFGALDGIIQSLRSLRISKGQVDHRSDVHKLMAESIIPIELAHKNALIQIARTDDPYSLLLI